ncbi:M48 family metallopeptidase [Chitinophaga sp. MM2321]|uniref:M48 family metallopeptidase n=1 Tax=Chitinophaga sp. MM2321 TaxID=3137178 RepID=UPI0032D59377
MTSLYPESPGNLYPVLLQPTMLFKQQIVKVISYIVLFFLLYVVLLMTTVALSIACLTGGIVLIGMHPKVYTIITGLGLVLLGGMLLFFLVIFLFNKRAPSHPYRTRINADSHPRLFNFITQLVKETQISFPKKIFVVPEVNTSVFYNSSLLSLFWPGRKNLEIGLGLVNSVNISEFKMVLAHEFAHFSRRSMKLGSYVYALNKALYNMLYENDRWSDIIIRWGSGGSLLGFFAHITTWIVNGIRYLLRKLYQLINRQYLELSREMELHADTLAVSLAGTKAAISSMRRMEMGSYCMDHCMHKLPELEDHAFRFRNIFNVQRALLQYYAGQNNMVLDPQGLPVITDTYFHTFLKSRVQLRDQWTSHPTREDREEHYQQANVCCKQLTVSAWLLFNEPENLQERVTCQVYDMISPGSRPFEWLAPDSFIKDLTQQHRLYEYPRTFNDYYDNRSFPVMNGAISGLLQPEEAGACNLQSIYHPDIVRRMRRFYRDRQDVETLQAIAVGQFQTRYFEFDGQKYVPGHALQLARQLAAQVEAEQQWLFGHDQLAFCYHYRKALEISPETAATMQEKYCRIVRHQEYSNRLNDQVIRVIHGISQLFGTSHTTIDQLQPCFDELSAECWNFRKLLHEITSDKIFTSAIAKEMKEKIRRFRQQECIFIRDHVPDYVAIQELHEITSSVMEQYNNNIILLKKSFLEFILTFEPR